MGENLESWSAAQHGPANENPLMRIQLESTSQIVEVNGVPARVWEGATESGVAVACLITRIAVKRDADCSQFEAELKETRPPTAELNAFPLRMVL